MSVSSGTPAYSRAFCLFFAHGQSVNRDEEDPHNRFHPRVLMKTTLSFAHLDDYTKSVLGFLYNDYFFRRYPVTQRPAAVWYLPHLRHIDRQDHEWALSALKKLGVLRDASDMLICVEDLGMIPDCVQGVLDHLALIALRVQRYAHQSDC